MIETKYYLCYPLIEAKKIIRQLILFMDVYLLQISFRFSYHKNDSLAMNMDDWII